MTLIRLLLLLVFFGFGQSVSAASVVALLPLSGTHAQAGQQVLKGLKRVLKQHQVMAVDRAAYADLGGAWQKVMSHRPDWVVGPLATQDVAVLVSQIQPTVPVLALNRIEATHPFVWQFALPTEQSATQLANYLTDTNIERILLCIHQSTSADRLWRAFVEALPNDVVDAVSFASVAELGKVGTQLLHADRGEKRIRHLTQVIPELVTAYPWIRQDADALVLFSPLNEALEMSYLVDYLWGQSLGIYWLDSGHQSVQDFVASAVNWGRMQTVLPTYLVEAMQKETTQEERYNFFDALGQDAGRLVTLLPKAYHEDEENLLGSGKLGVWMLEKNQRIGVVLNHVWLGDGVVEIVE